MIREDETVAQAFGIDVTRYKLLAFVLAGAIAGLAGALYGSSIGLVNSDVFPLELSLRIVLFVIIGGVGRRWGAAVAAVVLLSLNPKLPRLPARLRPDRRRADRPLQRRALPRRPGRSRSRTTGGHAPATPAPPTRTTTTSR